jgi:multidrug resistance efflux pump
MSENVATHAPHASATAEPEVAESWWATSRARKVGAASLAAVIVGFVYWLVYLHPYVSTDDARVAATLVRVAPDTIGGRVIRLNVTEGSRVKAGEILLELDHRTASAQLERAKAKTILTAREFKRVSELVRQKGLPARELDVAQANSNFAESELKLAEVADENTSIRSPIDGIVVQKATEVGNIVEPGQTVVTVSDIDHAWIAANIEETSVGPIAIGQPVTVVVDEGGKLTGKVSEVRGATMALFSLIPAENPSGNFTKLVQRIPIKIVLDPHPELILRSGQSVEIRIRTK